MKAAGISMILLFLFSGFSRPKPKVLVIGDSISIGYFPYVKKELSDVALLTHNPGNAMYTGNGLREIKQWIGKEKWDIIQFNWGLWDLAYRRPTPEDRLNRDRINGKVTHTTEEYAKNLDSLVKILKATGAKLIFVTITYVPEQEPGRYTKDVKRYNEVAKRAMRANGVLINDIYTHSKKIHKKYGLGDDNVHYNEKGYKHLAQYIYRFLRKEL